MSEESTTPVLDLGDGAGFGILHQKARLIGSEGHIRQQRSAWAFLWQQDLIVQVTVYPERDMDKARATAERLADSTRDIDAYLACCSENVELLGSMAGAEYLGADGIKGFFTEIEDIGPDFWIEVQRVQAIGDSTAIACVRVGATGRASGIVTGAESANVYDFIEGKISRIRIFLDRDEALKAVGLAE